MALHYCNLDISLFVATKTSLVCVPFVSQYRIRTTVYFHHVMQWNVHHQVYRQTKNLREREKCCHDDLTYVPNSLGLPYLCKVRGVGTVCTLTNSENHLLLVLQCYWSSCSYEPQDKFQVKPFVAELFKSYYHVSNPS